MKRNKVRILLVLINKMTYFTQINAQQHFVYVTFQQILSNQELKILLK